MNMTGNTPIAAINTLSVLIPCYNSDATPLVRQLLPMLQCETISWEVIVADDGSPNTVYSEQNAQIGDMPNCQFIRKERNEGSAATRNFLATQSRYDWLLYLDCDIEIPDHDFIKRYIQSIPANVINGGIRIKEDSTHSGNLRYAYERHEEGKHTAERRQMMKHKEFRSTNFIIRRKDIMRCPFDERFKASGYEDVLFGKHLKQADISISHIPNPVMMADFENNADYVVKTERNLRTLKRFSQELRGYSHLLTFVEGIHIPAILNLMRLWHQWFGRWERKNLTGSHPSLLLFKLYRLGFFLCLEREEV